MNVTLKVNQQFLSSQLSSLHLIDTARNRNIIFFFYFGQWRICKMPGSMSQMPPPGCIQSIPCQRREARTHNTRMENGNSPDMLATCQTLRFFCPLPWKSFKAGEKQGGGGVMYHPCQIDIACSSQWIELPACGDCIVVLAPDRNFPHSALVEVLNVEMSRFPIKVITIRRTHL